MADIHANGKMTAKITVGNVTTEGISEAKINKLLETKAEKEHTHDEYPTYSQFNRALTLKASKNHEHDEYLTEVPNNYAFTRLTHVIGYDEETGEIKYYNRNFTQDEFAEYLGTIDETVHNTAEIAVNNSDDIKKINKTLESNCATKEELNEVKQSVSNGKELLASAITDKGVNTSKDDTFQTMANNVSQITTGDGPVYENPDFYELRTKGGTDYSGLFSYSRIKSLDLSSWDTSNVTDMSYMFNFCIPLTSLDFSNFNTSKVTDMSYMFSSCTSLTSLDLTNFDTSNVTNMSYMFNESSDLTSLDLSNFNTSKVTNMYRMFHGCTSLTSLDLSSFNTSKVADMTYMFRDCPKLTSLDLTNFDTSNVTTMSYMFYGCSELTSLIIPNWDMNKTTSYKSFFGSNLNSIKNLTYIDLSNSDDGTISKIASRLHSRSASSPGSIVIPANTSQDIINTLQSKYWNPVYSGE